MMHMDETTRCWQIHIRQVQIFGHPNLWYVSNPSFSKNHWGQNWKSFYTMQDKSSEVNVANKNTGLPAKEHPQRVQNPSRPWRLRVHPSILRAAQGTQHATGADISCFEAIYCVFDRDQYIYCKKNIKQQNVTNHIMTSKYDKGHKWDLNKDHPTIRSHLSDQI